MKIDPWLNLFCSVLKEQAIKDIGYLEEEHIKDSLSLRQYEVWQYLSGKGEARVGEIVTGTNIALSTVRQAIERLLVLQKIKRVGPWAEGSVYKGVKVSFETLATTLSTSQICL